MIRCEIIDGRSFGRLRTRALLEAEAGLREVCGILIRHANGTIHLRFLPNLATQPAKWLIQWNWLTQIRAELKGTPQKLVGTFHSHVGGYAYPSQSDLDYYPSGFLMMIYDIATERVGLWRPYIRKGRGKLFPVAVCCKSPLWEKDDAISHALHLKELFKKKAKRNRS